MYVNPQAIAALAHSALFVRIPTIADRMPLVADGLLRHEAAAVFVHIRPAA